MPHLLVTISPHGYGHAMQTCLVLNALHQCRPDLRITLQTTVSRDFLSSRLNLLYTLLPINHDFGMLMNSAVDIDVPASHQAYQQAHENWPTRVTQTSQDLQHLQADVILADVPYLTLAAAAQIGVPTIALCSLNWFDIYKHYCHDLPQADKIQQQMLDAYQSAAVFLQPQPSMPMPELHNTQSIGCLAELGENQRESLLQQLQLPENTRLILVALGGINMPCPVHRWPVLKNTCWLIPSAWHTERSDMRVFNTLALSFIDTLCSCDLILTKPGYGSFTEAACNGIPTLYLRREDWPETPYLTDWLHQHTAAQAITREQLHHGDLQNSIEQVLALPRPSPPAPTGAEQAAQMINDYL